MMQGHVPYPDEFVKRYREKGYWLDKTLGDDFDEFTGKYKNRVAVSAAGKHVTYSEMAKNVNRLALHFVEKGLRTYDTAILQLPNELEFIYCFFALVKIGVVPIMSLPAHRDAEITFFAQFAGAKAHFMPASFKDFSHQEMSRQARAKAPSLEFGFVSGKGVEPGFISISELLADRIEERIHVESLKRYRPNPMEPGVIQLSGGTTGVPKLIARIHNDYTLNYRGIAKEINVTKDTVTGIAIPVNHNFALACPGVLGTLYHGGRVVLIPTPRNDVVLQAIQNEKITLMPTPPALLIRWMEDPDLARYDISSLEWVIAGGARLNAEVAKKIKPVLGCNYFQNLGMAEGMAFWSRPGDDEDLLLNSQGAPLFDDDEIRIVDENERDVPYGERGELLVRGPNTIRGYFNAPEYNKKAFTADGFYRTGDVVRFYKGRYVSVEGRIKDTINRGAEKISAEEVENHILAHPKVENCAFIAMPDHVLGEKGCAFVLTRDSRSLTLDELNKFLKEERNIATFKLPERLELVTSFPMTNVGKIDKKELRRIIAEKLKKEEGRS
ncbi:MAG: 2,3-dihydroxybenzoate-AMP ligase [Syntrophorhabdus sp. PtaU1.Bin153]|nr:MAG: 2,3-dihydroxybenzoate-AMP ligase [Syntrophorhabdus sp. PtaU1.Bin153]